MSKFRIQSFTFARRQGNNGTCGSVVHPEQVQDTTFGDHHQYLEIPAKGGISQIDDLLDSVINRLQKRRQPSCSELQLEAPLSGLPLQRCP